MLPIFVRITPSPKSKKPFAGTSSEDIARMAASALAQYNDQLGEETKLLLAGQSTNDQVKGLRTVMLLESRLLAKFCHDNYQAGLNYVTQHPHLQVLRRADFGVQLKLSSPDLSYYDLVDIARQLDAIKREREGIPAPDREPNVHRGRRRVHA